MPKKRKMRQYDWQKIAREYIEGIINEKGETLFPSLPILAEKYGCTLSTVGRHCSKEQWAVKRERFANKVSKSRQREKAAVLSEEGARYDLECFNISREGIEKAKEMLARAEKPGDVATLARAMKDLQAVAKTAIGDSDGTADGSLRIEVTLDED
ncbi:hypothetical protein [Mitsuokella jalaludinii]|uniref:hypothetical protein n=1 Tax=Mitsuokella jalaludinii TaxID=187979 RepID=UPI00308083BC